MAIGASGTWFGWGGSLVAGAVLAGCTPSGGSASRSAAEVVEGGAATDSPNEGEDVLVFLHGTIGPTAEARAEADRVRAHIEQAARGQGFTVFAPEGVVGLCDWNDEVKSDVCWPSDERRLSDARRIVEGWKLRLGTAAAPRVLGFSNGAAFALLLAAHQLLPMRSVVALHGAPAGEVHVAAGQHPPTLLYSGDAAAWERPQFDAVAQSFAAAGYQVERGSGAGPHAVDDAALAAAMTWLAGH